MAGAAVLINAGELIGPNQPSSDLAVDDNFERFDGLAQPPLDHPAGRDRTDFYPAGPRPGMSADTPDVYTPGPLSGVVGVVGGQPLPVSPRIHKDAGAFTQSRTPSIQHRIGVGQKGPSALGADQTVALSEITNAPPVPGDLSSIIAGLA